MKKLEQLGRSLNKSEQKKIVGGYDEGATCTYTYIGSNVSAHLVLVITMLNVIAV